MERMEKRAVPDSSDLYRGVGIDVLDFPLLIGNAAVGTDISYRESRIGRSVFLQGDLVDFAKTELLNLHLLMSQHIVVKIQSG